MPIGLEDAKCEHFPWSKKPSESTLAGSNPSLNAPSTTGGSFASSGGTPTSPATNNTPTLLSSANSRGSSPYGNLAGGNRSTIPTASDFTVPSANPNTGLAANANGYQTGPYGMAGNRTGLTAPSPSGVPNGVAANQAPAGFAPATGFNNNVPGTPQPRSANTNMAFNPTQPQGLPAGLPAAPSFNQPNGQPAQALPTMVAATNSLPPQASFGAPGLPPAPTMPNNSMMNSSMAPNNMVPTIPAGMSATNMASMPPAAPNFSMPNAAASAGPGQSMQTAAASYSGASPYRPGSTSRSTAYDFSRQTPSNPASAPHTATGLPPASQQNVFR